MRKTHNILNRFIVRQRIVISDRFLCEATGCQIKRTYAFAPLGSTLSPHMHNSVFDLLLKDFNKLSVGFEQRLLSQSWACWVFII